MKGFFGIGAIVALLSGVTSEEICYLPLDVMFLQDTTGSFDDDLPNVERQIPHMVDQILASHPDSHFGVAEFKDKPYYPLGEDDDFCYKLGDGKLSGDLSDFSWAYSLLYASGGGDLPESQFQALINIALDPKIGWRKLPAVGSQAAGSDETGARLVIISTDAVPHLPGDLDHYSEEQYPDLPRDLTANSGIISTGDPDFECLFEDYPSADQTRAALKSMNITLLILTPEDPDIVPAWKWVNEQLLGQPANFYQFISHDSSDLLDAVLRALAAVTETACPPTPKPTAAPTHFPTILPPDVPTEAPTVAPAGSTESAVTTGLGSTVTTVGSTTQSTTVTTKTAIATSTTTAAASSTVPSDSTSKTDCAPCPVCPPCPEPPCIPECPPCDDPCNHGVIVKISDKPKHVLINIENTPSVPLV